MKKILFLSVVLMHAFITYAQYTIKLSIQKSEDKTPLPGATAIISSISRTTIADSLGIATFASIAAGTYNIKVSYVGLEEKEVTVAVPQPDSAIVEVLLEEAEEHEDEIVITATRTSRIIKDIPTRVET